MRLSEIKTKITKQKMKTSSSSSIITIISNTRIIIWYSAIWRGFVYMHVFALVKSFSRTPSLGPLLHLLFGAPLSHGCHLINRHAHTYTRSRTAFMHARPHVLPLGCVNVKLRQHEIERNGEEKPLSTEGFCHRFGTDCKWPIFPKFAAANNN